jgi:putative transposase
LKDKASDLATTGCHLTERQQRISDFRYGVIAELVFSHVEAAERSRLIAQKSARQWTIPYSSRTTITTSCIRKWVNAYQLQGRAALIPKIRKDTGVSKVLTDADKEMILKLLEEKPQLCASVAVRVLQREGKLVKNVSRSALSRFLLASGVGRAERARSKTKDQVLRYNFEMPLECVQVDAMHSFQVPDFKGGLSKAILIAFIDDATRRIVYSRFCFTEN